MNNSEKLRILSAAVHSGKTGALQKFLQNRKNVTGILCPDIRGMRQLFNIETSEYFRFQINEEEAKTEEHIRVGMYIFSSLSFKTARKFIDKIPNSETTYAIIDEIGKLEMEDLGLEPAFGQLMNRWKQSPFSMIVVVRDYLLEAFLTKYQPGRYEVIRPDQLELL